MKKLIPLIGLFVALPCFGQTVSNTTPTPAPLTTGTNGGSFHEGGDGKRAEMEKLEQMTPEERREFLEDHPEIRERLRHEREEMLEKLQGMTPEQRQAFLKNHPEVQKFINDHPELAEKIANGDADHPRKEERRDGEEMLDKLQSMTPDQRAEFLKNHPQVQKFINDHPELAERIAKGDGDHPRREERRDGEEMLDKLQSMTPEQRAEFLKNHLQVQKFLTDHPELAERIAKGDAADHPRREERRDGEEMLDKLQSMTPEQRAEFLKNHPQVQKFINDHPEFAKRIANGDPGHPRVNEVNDREQDEQKRIDEGLKNGTLTPEEAAKLQKRLDQVKKQEAADEAKNNGHLTAEEKRRLNREENKESRHIARDKGNDQGANANGGGNNGGDHDGDGGRDGGGNGGGNGGGGRNGGKGR